MKQGQWRPNRTEVSAAAAVRRVRALHASGMTLRQIDARYGVALGAVHALSVGAERCTTDTSARLTGSAGLGRHRL